MWISLKSDKVDGGTVLVSLSQVTHIAPRPGGSKIYFTAEESDPNGLTKKQRALAVRDDIEDIAKKLELVGSPAT